MILDVTFHNNSPLTAQAACLVSPLALYFIRLSIADPPTRGATRWPRVSYVSSLSCSWSCLSVTVLDDLPHSVVTTEVSIENLVSPKHTSLGLSVQYSLFIDEFTKCQRIVLHSASFKALTRYMEKRRDSRGLLSLTQNPQHDNTQAKPRWTSGARAALPIITIFANPAKSAKKWKSNIQ